MQIKEILQKSTLFFKERNFPSARLDAELLLSYLLQCEREDLLLQGERKLETKDVDAYRQLVALRGKGKPVEYLTQHTEFFSLPFRVREGVLVPRPESEGLVEEALRWVQIQLKLDSKLEQSLRIVDIGCGSGCIGLSLLHHLPQGRLLAVDLSRKACEVTHENAQLLQLSHRVQILHKDIEKVEANHLLEKSFNFPHIIVTNPPYLDSQDPAIQESVRSFEPALALFAADAGYRKIKSWSLWAGKTLARPGLLLCEVGHEQATSTKTFLEESGFFKNLQAIPDLAGKERIVLAEKNL